MRRTAAVSASVFSRLESHRAGLVEGEADHASHQSRHVRNVGYRDRRSPRRHHTERLPWLVQTRWLPDSRSMSMKAAPAPENQHHGNAADHNPIFAQLRQASARGQALADQRAQSGTTSVQHARFEGPPLLWPLSRPYWAPMVQYAFSPVRETGLEGMLSGRHPIPFAAARSLLGPPRLDSGELRAREGRPRMQSDLNPLEAT